MHLTKILLLTLTIKRKSYKRCIATGNAARKFKCIEVRKVFMNLAKFLREADNALTL